MEDLLYQGIIDHLILEELGNGKTITLGVSGKSMHPLIRHGDSVRLEKCTPGAPAIGDIITFRKEGMYFTHRVVWTIKRGDCIRLITKGDNEINIDPPVPPSYIVGKVRAIARANRTLHLETRPWRFINRLLGFFFLLETISIMLYRFTAGRFHLFRTFFPANVKPSFLYHHFKSRGLRLATRIIM